LRTMSLAVLFFGACAVFLGMKAAANDRGLIINGLIELSSGGATIFYWVIAATSFVFVAAGVFLTVLGLTLAQRIIVTDSCIVVPKSRFTTELVTVPFDGIQDWSETEVQGHRFLKIMHQEGTFEIVASMLPAKEDLAQIRDAVQHGVEKARARRGR
jgi:hypothetical protein